MHLLRGGGGRCPLFDAGQASPVWLRLAFFALAIAAATLGIASYSQIRTLGGYLGLVLLGLSAVGMVLAGLFETDPITASAGARTPDGRLHELGAMLDSMPPSP